MNLLEANMIAWINLLLAIDNKVLLYIVLYLDIE